MNKKDLVVAIAKQTQLSRSDATHAVDATFASITDALKAGDDVKITGFGSFSVFRRAASEGRNPKTGETIHIPESNNARFRPSKPLKEALN